ncbi:MAG TPA: hypothetical protein VIJ96_03125 [Acidothermaceae bacterium]
MVAALLVALSVAGDVQHGLTIAVLQVMVLASLFLILGERRLIRISTGERLRSARLVAYARPVVDTFGRAQSRHVRTYVTPADLCVCADRIRGDVMGSGRRVSRRRG